MAERAFTRRQPNVNPIALELDRLAEQKALATLGRGGPSADRTATDAPMASDDEIAQELAQQQQYSARIMRMNEARNAGQWPAAKAELEGLSDRDLAVNADFADSALRTTMQVGDAWLDPDSGEMHTVDDPDTQTAVDNHLAIIQENDRRKRAREQQAFEQAFQRPASPNARR